MIFLWQSTARETSHIFIACFLMVKIMLISAEIQPLTEMSRSLHNLNLEIFQVACRHRDAENLPKESTRMLTSLLLLLLSLLLLLLVLLLLLFVSILFFHFHSMQVWIATVRTWSYHKKSTNRLKHTGNLFKTEKEPPHS